jgi:hypothetical protein
VNQPTARAENLRIFVPQIIGLDIVVRELNDLEPGLVKQMKKDLVTEIKPLYQTIKSTIESSKPFLSGFQHSGRTGISKNPVRVTGKAVTGRRGRKTSLVSIRTTSAAAEIADMAGRKTQGGGVQLPYEYKGIGRSGGSGSQSPTRSRPVTRRGNSAPFSYRINGQGQAMIRNLRRTASRYVYPPLAILILGVRDEMVKTLDSYVGRINQKLKV